MITRPLPEILNSSAKKLGDLTVRSFTSPLSETETISALLDYDYIVPTLGDNFSKAIFDKLDKPKCKMLANFGAGYNHIDVESALEKGIVVTNTPDVVTNATADIALTLMLMTARRAGEGERLVRAKKWKGWHPMQMLGQNITGKTAGIIGMGRIGEAIARRCYFGFCMKVIFTNTSTKNLDFPASQIDTITETVRNSDIIFVSVPGSSRNRHLINKDIFLSMKKNSILINIARGDIVDESALIDALNSKKIAGAGLDVYEFEPFIPDNLLKFENVTLLPHLGTASLEIRTSMGEIALNNIRSHINRKEPPNLIKSL